MENTNFIDVTEEHRKHFEIARNMQPTGVMFSEEDITSLAKELEKGERTIEEIVKSGDGIFKLKNKNQ